MTITSNRPRLAVVRHATAAPACTADLAWCTGARNTHDVDVLHENESVYHDSEPVDLPMTGGGHAAGDGFTISLERQDTLDGKPGQTRVYMAVTSDRIPAPCGGYATLDEAERIARAILAHVLGAHARPGRDAGALAAGDRWPFGQAAFAALRRLAPRQRIAMSLRYVDGCSVSETASLMGVRPDRVKVYVSRAKAQLRAWGVLDTPAVLDGAA